MWVIAVAVEQQNVMTGRMEAKAYRIG